MKEDIKTIKPDGNDFQYKVKKALEDLGWVVRMSPHYNDSFSEKPREIDIITEKLYAPAQNSVYNSSVIVRLFIECKYVAEQTTFWFQERDSDKAKEVVDSTRSFHEVDKNFEVQRNHHYLAEDLIAKLYRTDGKNPDGDPVYKAITQCLNATIYYRNHTTELSKKNDRGRQLVEELNYSVIVCNSFDKFLKKDTTNGSEVTEITEPFQLEVDYAYTTKTTQVEEMFYIDILSIDHIQSFEDVVLSKEINLAKQKLSDDEREAAFHRMKEERPNYDPFDAI